MEPSNEIMTGECLLAALDVGAGHWLSPLARLGHGSACLYGPVWTNF